MSDADEFKFASFPHGKKPFVIASIVLSLAGFALSLGQGSGLGMTLGLAVAVIMSLTTSKPMPQISLSVAALSALAIAGYQVMEMHNLYKTARSPLMQNMCPIANTMKEQSDDIYGRMYSQYGKYCGSGYKVAMLLHVVALVNWIACGVLVFLVPPLEQREALIGRKDLDEEPVTDYVKVNPNTTSNEAVAGGGGEMA